MTETKKFDVVVIGAGPGGYVAAIKAAQNRKKVALIEKGLLGGTCLNVGCIPTKTLIANAEVMHKIQHAADFGITTGPISFDFGKMKQRKDSVLEKMRKSLGGLIQSNGIEVIKGVAEFTGPKELKVKGDASCLVQADAIIIATGSEPLEIGAFPCDHKVVFNSTSILELTELPKTLAIIGGGYIGCEFASLYAALGVKVTILEALPSIVSLQGKTVSDALTAAFKKQGIDIRTGVVVEGIDKTAAGASVRLKGLPAFECDKVLVAVGRKIVSAGLGLEKAGVQVGEKGAIVVNDRMETNVPGIYAIGDVTGKFLLAHVASHQGVVAAANATGQEGTMHYDAVPAVIFTMPEVATVGKTLEEALAAGMAAKTGRFPFMALGKAVASMESDGFAEVVIDQKTGAILGAQVIGHDAASLIAEMALAIANELTVDCVAETIHAHPTLPEAWLEASLLAVDTPIHFPPKIKR
ncbi:MAG: dihydrolipoyl dehydrogenase [Verrucomicrobia bacterium]|nr:dihydrolipoyl dehydrogenase [Verrucomicrobiota bacterium]